MILTLATILLPWVLSNHQELEVPPCLSLAGLDPVFSARICAVVFSTFPACSSCPGVLSVSCSFLWRSSLFVLPLLLSPAYCLGISGDVVLTCVFFPKASKVLLCKLGRSSPCCLCLPCSPLVSAFLTPASQYGACLFPPCVPVPPTSRGPCSDPVVLSLSCFSSSALPPLCLETLLKSWSLGPCQSPS